MGPHVYCFLLFIYANFGINQGLQHSTYGFVDLIKHPKTLGEDLIDDPDKFEPQANAAEFLKYFKSHGLLPKDKAFNFSDPSIKEETIRLIDFLYFTKDVGTFSKLAESLSSVCNREQLAYALAVVSTHRPDIEGTLPNWYDVFPNYFVKQSALEALKEAAEKGVESLVVDIEQNEEDKTAYFREDWDLNNQYYNWLIHYPNWMDPQKYGLAKITERALLIKQFYTLMGNKYKLECTANNLTTLPFLGINEISQVGYKPDLVNSVGQKLDDWMVSNISMEYYHDFSTINPSGWIRDNKSNEILETNAIITKNGNQQSLDELGDKAWELLADLMFDTPDNPNPEYYGSYIDIMTTFFSNLPMKNHSEGAGTVISYPMAALRDQNFFSIMNGIDFFFQSYGPQFRKPYAVEDVFMMGIDITGVESDRLETFFDHFELDVSQSVKKSAAPGSYKVRQKRLNHDPFRIRINITNSNQDPVRGTLWIHLVPKLNASFPHQDEFLFEIDRFPVKLAVGENKIERDLKHSTIFGVGGDKEDESEGVNDCGLPNRLLLPRGSEEGIPLNMIVAVTPLRIPEQQPAHKHFTSYGLCESPGVHDDRFLGYILERRLPSRQNITPPPKNAHIHEIVVYHRN